MTDKDKPDDSQGGNRNRPKYTMAELLAQCDFSSPLSKEQEEEDREWLDMPSVGREL